MINKLIWKKQVIPWVLDWDGVGRPSFTRLDLNKVRLCLDESRCLLCGGILSLRNRVWIGEEDQKWFGEPPLHPACAETVVDTCPFLGGDNILYFIYGIGLERNPDNDLLSRPGHIKRSIKIYSGIKVSQ